MKNVGELLNEYFKFWSWNASEVQPKSFSSQLNTFGSFTIHSNFKEFLSKNEYYLEELAEGSIDTVLKSKESYDSFVEDYLNVNEYFQLDYADVNKEFVVGEVTDSSEPKLYFKTISKINHEEDLIDFLNEVLKDSGEVTHSTGLKNEFEVVEIDK